MGNLAGTYLQLGRHADALAMGERVLEFQRRVLPADHPDIGEGSSLRDGLHAVWVILRGMILFDITCRYDHGQPCSGVL